MKIFLSVTLIFNFLSFIKTVLYGGNINVMLKQEQVYVTIKKKKVPWQYGLTPTLLLRFFFFFIIRKVRFKEDQLPSSLATKYESWKWKKADGYERVRKTNIMSKSQDHKNHGKYCYRKGKTAIKIKKKAISFWLTKRWY